MPVLSKEDRIRMLTESDDEWERNRQDWIKLHAIKKLNQFHTETCRAYANGTLPQEHIDMCNKVPFWTWNQRLNQRFWNIRDKL
jgi:hypothetical protein